MGSTGETDIIDFSIVRDLDRLRRKNKYARRANRRINPNKPPMTAPAIAPLEILLELPVLVMRDPNEGSDLLQLSAKGIAFTSE